MPGISAVPDLGGRQENGWWSHHLVGIAQKTYPLSYYNPQLTASGTQQHYPGHL